MVWNNKKPVILFGEEGKADWAELAENLQQHLRVEIAEIQ